MEPKLQRELIRGLPGRSLKELDRVALGVLEMGHPAMRSHVPDFIKHLSPLCPRATERQLQIVHLKYEDSIPGRFRYGFSRTRDTKSGLLSSELNPFAAVGEADRQSEGLVEPRQFFWLDGSKIDVLEFHILTPDSEQAVDLRFSASLDCPATIAPFGRH